MVAKSSPEWLPAGWSVQFREQKRGRKTVIYTHLETGKKLFSKVAVIRHAEMASTRGEEPQPTNTKKSSDKSHSQLAANTDECPEWLPDGWKVELKTRKTGTQVGRDYKCYIDPSTECRFYSKPEVFRYLKTVKRKSCKSRNHKMVVVEKHHVEDLPPGWISEIKVRKVANRIRRDPYYTDPVRGYVFRSKKEVIHYLQTGETSRHTIKPKSMGANDLMLINDEIAASPSSATKKQNLKHPVTRRQLSEAKKSSETSGLELPETESSKLQDKRPTKSIGALAPKTEVVLENHLNENLVEECVENKEDCCPSWSSQPNAEPSGKNICKRSSQPKAELSDKRETKRSKLQDKRLIAESKVALAPTAEAVPQKHLTESMVEKCAETKEDCSPSKSSQPKAELSNKREGRTTLVEVDSSSTDPGKVIFSKDEPALTPAAYTLNKKNSFKSQMEKNDIRRPQIDARKSKNKEKLNLPRRSSKRLAGLEPEPVNNLVSSVQALEVATRKSCKRDGSQDAGLASDDFVNRTSRQLGDASETKVAHHTITQVKSTLQGEPLSKVNRPLDGLELQPVDTLVSNEQTLQVATRKSGRGDSSRDTGLASYDFVNGASLQLGAASEQEAAHDTLIDINSPSHGESLNKGNMLLDDQVVPKEQHHKLETEKPGPELRLLFGSDPCLEFAFKTLTGELPIADTVNNKPILKPAAAADMLQKENSLENGSCSRKTRAISNKSKKAKGLQLPHRTSKRLAGAEPELLAKPMSSERALRKAMAKSCRSNSIQAVDLAHEASQQFEADQEKKVANDPIINPSLYEESSNKIEKSVKDQAVSEEKPQKLEIEKAAVENPQSQFSFPFLDTWSDPCLDFAFKTLTGEIPIEDDLFQGYFQENLDTSHNQKESLALPDFGSPSFFQSDISPQFDAPEQSVSGQLFPMSSSLPPTGNVGLSNCNGVGFGQQLSMNSSFLPAGNVRFSNGSGVASGQQLSMNSSYLPAGNMALSNWSGVGTQKPCLGGKTDFHGKVKS